MRQDKFKINHDLRVKLVKMFFKSKAGHLAPALSCLDILAALYLGGVISKVENPCDRDRVVLSKGHGCAALYVVLSEAGIIPKEELSSFYQYGTRLQGHPSLELPGVETGTGSLGHGICFATGTALAAKLDGKSFHTYVIAGDGETQEGSVWEAAMFASHHGLNNLTVIIDHNKLQCNDCISAIIETEPLGGKWESFGWHVERVDGHDSAALVELLQSKPGGSSPLAIIADTTKGKGLSFMENDPSWHCRAPKGDEWGVVCQELGITVEELERL